MKKLLFALAFAFAASAQAECNYSKELTGEHYQDDRVLMAIVDSMFSGSSIALHVSEDGSKMVGAIDRGSVEENISFSCEGAALRLSCEDDQDRKFILSYTAAQAYKVSYSNDGPVIFYACGEI